MPLKPWTLPGMRVLGEVGTIQLTNRKGLGDAVSRIIKDHLRSFPGLEMDVADIPCGFQSDGPHLQENRCGILALACGRAIETASNCKAL